jgi:c-di-GMP-binding flagellar brake protein YcgR
MTGDDLRVNQLLEIEMEYNEKKVIFASRVEEIEQEYLVIAAPIRKGILQMPPSGTEILIQFRHRETLWGFQSQVIAKRLRPIPVWLIKKPSKFIKLAQKRNWVRLGVTLPLQFEFLDRDDDEKYEGFTVDISGGGLLLSSYYECKTGERLKLDLLLNEENTISLVARVVRTFDKDEKALQRYRVALEYEDISEILRDKVIKFVFDKQRENIRKGLPN